MMSQQWSHAKHATRNLFFQIVSLTVQALRYWQLRQLIKKVHVVVLAYPRGFFKTKTTSCLRFTSNFLFKRLKRKYVSTPRTINFYFGHNTNADMGHPYTHFTRRRGIFAQSEVNYSHPTEQSRHWRSITINNTIAGSQVWRIGSACRHFNVTATNAGRCLMATHALYLYLCLFIQLCNL